MRRRERRHFTGMGVRCVKRTGYVSLQKKARWTGVQISLTWKSIWKTREAKKCVKGRVIWKVGLQKEKNWRNWHHGFGRGSYNAFGKSQLPFGWGCSGHSELGIAEPWKRLGRAVFYLRTFLHGYSDRYIFEDSFRSQFSLVLHEWDSVPDGSLVDPFQSSVCVWNIWTDVKLLLVLFAGGLEPMCLSSPTKLWHFGGWVVWSTTCTCI